MRKKLRRKETLEYIKSLCSAKLQLETKFHHFAIFSCSATSFCEIYLFEQLNLFVFDKIIFFYFKNSLHVFLFFAIVKLLLHLNSSSISLHSIIFRVLLQISMSPATDLIEQVGSASRIWKQSFNFTSNFTSPSSFVCGWRNQ